jgi:hypothetical protein
MKIIDNAIPEQLFEKLVNQFNLNNEFFKLPMYFVAGTARYKEFPNPLETSWYHLIYEDEQIESHTYDTVESAFIVALDAVGERLHKIIRMRMGFITAQPNTIIHDPHVDYKTPHRTALLYLNDSDGDTYFYNSDPFLVMENDFQVTDKVSPKANRFVTFDGLTYHSSSTPSKSLYRAVININYLTKEIKCDSK